MCSGVADMEVTERHTGETVVGTDDEMMEFIRFLAYAGAVKIAAEALPTGPWRITWTGGKP